eukprot:TRINITY_DN2381_c0_g1_i2.p1 TRINITY_DN2381_c0_g1~~TRINITY_DN2381_c0_g1_i2.p1  ORF type:complete len:319 (-),score=44.02 TRINITY_DN2381_c0_g1_i2:35-991(-)
MMVFALFTCQIGRKRRHSCGKRLFPAVDVSKKFIRFGGVPRHVFSTPDANFKLSQALDRVDIESVTECITQVDSKKDVSHWLIHWVPIPDYSEFRISFTSPYVQAKVIERFAQKEKEKLVKLLRASSDNDLGVFGSLCGSLFEGYAHSLLSKGGIFRVRNLRTNKEEELEIPTKPHRFVDAFTPDDANSYLQPKARNFGGIDSWEKGMLFQMTVSLHHPIKLGAIVPVLTQANGWPLYFVVPCDRFKEFREQKATVSKETTETSISEPESEKRKFDESTLADYLLLFENVEQYVLMIKLAEDSSSSKVEEELDDDIYE